MMNLELSVSEDLNREPGYTIFTVSGVEENIERISFSIVRQGYDYNYLGEKSWQAASVLLEPEDAWYEDGRLKFILPPDMTWLMDPQGYNLKLMLYPRATERSINFFWPDILPAEAAVPPNDQNRLSGKAVKPDAEPPPVAPQVTELSEIVEKVESEPPQVLLKTEVESDENLPAEKNNKKGKTEAVVLVILILLILGGLVWLLLKPGSDSVQDEANEPIKTSIQEQGQADTQAMDQGSSKNKPSNTKQPGFLEKRRTGPKVNQPELLLERKKPVKVLAPNESGVERDETLDSLTDYLSREAPETDSQTESDLFKSIEPALREKVGE